MELWTASILIATLLYGGLHFLYKVAAEAGGEGDELVSIAGGTVAVLALITLCLTQQHPLRLFTGPVFFYACLNGLMYALAMLTNFGALKRAPAAVVFPLNHMNSLLVLLVGVFFFHELIHPIQYAGIAIGLSVLFLISREQKKNFILTRDRRVIAGILLALISAVFTTLSMTAGKLLADTSENRLAYMTTSYSLVFLFTFGRHSLRKRRLDWLASLVRTPRLSLYGLAIGCLNFAGYFLVLRAFGSGPISLAGDLQQFHHHSGDSLTPLLPGASDSLRVFAILLALLSVALISIRVP